MNNSRIASHSGLYISLPHAAAEGRGLRRQYGEEEQEYHWFSTIFLREVRARLGIQRDRTDGQARVGLLPPHPDQRRRNLTRQIHSFVTISYDSCRFILSSFCAFIG
ncbi:hypothetical protein HPP92_028861 [Vanilla planifolia]|uniref:Uncharacterized protein n=1 Tax=Vanilla planifolia TaxID=51239 RepID=A0A835U1W3_VANPL|nr:hypothetical protein HPP92_028861 [Vanilla planifolia]KAG0446394.1 hypothetical protein HPP92_028850 [Vanilla planifolia]